MNLSAATRLQAWLREDSHLVPEDTLPLLRALVRDFLASPASQRDIERDQTIAKLRVTYDDRMAGGSSHTAAIRAAAVEHGIAPSTAWIYLADD